MSKKDTKGRLPAHHPLAPTSESKKAKHRFRPQSRGAYIPPIVAAVFLIWYWVSFTVDVNTIGIPSFLFPSPVSDHSGDLKNEINNNSPVIDDDNGGLELRHIFHHGAGPKNYKLHRRLDITPQYIALRDFLALMADIAVAQEADLKASSLGPSTEADAEGKTLDNLLEDTVDWPRVHAGKNPFTVKLPLKFKQGKTQRLKDRHVPGFVEGYLDYAIKVKGNPKMLGRIGLEWEQVEEIPIPDMEDKDTIVSLATISSNAYVRFPKDDKEKDKSDWTDVGGFEPDTDDENVNFGWLEDGLRGHVFVNNKTNTVVIGIKGTLGAGLPGGGSDETASNDKINDNLLFSCCCARVGYMWTTVCDCYEKTYTCNQDCLERELLRQDRYYQAVMDLYHNVTLLYSPEKYNIWVTGHSLGGALASLLGRTFGLPTVAFEAPGELLATKRLHLPQAPGIPKHLENIWHVGNTADPIYMGVCNGATSSCNAAGYAMETQCHTGKQCVYDVVADKGWSVNLLNHRIHTVIDDIIMKYNETAQCVEALPCRDCFNWRYVTHDDSDGDEPELPNPLISRSSLSVKPTPTKTPSELTEGNHATSDKGNKEKTTGIPATGTTLSASKTATSTSTPTDRPQKCLERTWYGWCSKWGYDDDDSDSDNDSDNDSDSED